MSGYWDFRGIYFIFLKAATNFSITARFMDNLKLEDLEIYHKE
jgi:hypothetical protein